MMHSPYDLLISKGSKFQWKPKEQTMVHFTQRQQQRMREAWAEQREAQREKEKKV
jgi:hypothetical protein